VADVPSGPSWAPPPTIRIKKMFHRHKLLDLSYMTDIWFSTNLSKIAMARLALLLHTPDVLDILRGTSLVFLSREVNVGVLR
jgi:hypothetical protein